MVGFDSAYQSGAGQTSRILEPIALSKCGAGWRVEGYYRRQQWSVSGSQRMGCLYWKWNSDRYSNCSGVGSAACQEGEENRNVNRECGGADRDTAVLILGRC